MLQQTTTVDDKKIAAVNQPGQNEDHLGHLAKVIKKQRTFLCNQTNPPSRTMYTVHEAISQTYLHQKQMQTN